MTDDNKNTQKQKLLCPTTPFFVFILINTSNSGGTILLKVCAHLLLPGGEGAPRPRDPRVKGCRHQHAEKGPRSRAADRPRARSHTDPQREPGTSREHTCPGPVSPLLFRQLLHKQNWSSF